MQVWSWLQGRLKEVTVISEFHVDVAKVDRYRGKRDQRDWIMIGRLNERNMGSVVCRGRIGSVLLNQ